jgi:hypothetical protein
MSGIRESPVSQRVSEQQVAVFVMDARDGNGKQRQHGQPNANHAKKEKPGKQSFSPGQSSQWSRDRSERFLKPSRRKNCRHDKCERYTGKRPIPQGSHFKEKSLI